MTVQVPTHLRGAALLAPAVLLTGSVLALAVGALTLSGFGLMPVFGQPRLSAAGFTTQGGDLLLGVRESLLIATLAAALAAAVGLATALLVLGSRPGARVLAAVAAGVLPIPHLVGAAAVLLLLGDSGVATRLLGIGPEQWPELVGGAWPVGTVVELVWKESAFVALIVVASVGGRLGALTETAATLGATRWQRLRRVTLPLAGPGLAAASLLVFLYSLGAYEVAWLLGRTYPEPLPVMAYRLFTGIDLTSRPQAAAVALTATVLALLVALACAPLLRRIGAAR